MKASYQMQELDHKKGVQGQATFYFEGKMNPYIGKTIGKHGTCRSGFEFLEPEELNAEEFKCRAVQRGSQNLINNLWELQQMVGMLEN